MARFHTPDANPTRSRARAGRNLSLVLWWGAALILLFWISAGGPAIALLPLLVIGALVVSNTVQVVRGDTVVAEALPPGRLEQATTDDDPVLVSATRAPDNRERGRRRGTLGFEGGRLSFTFDAETRTRKGATTDALSGTTAFDVEPSAVHLGPRPSMLRPRLRLTIDGTVHVLEFTMPGDLAAGAVGAIVSREWWTQLRVLGATV